ncbi:MAG: NAD(P)-binding protein, partial [Cyanobacteria bacterium P01_H01_bin.153]
EPQLLSVPEALSDHVIVAGYGRVGQVIVNILLNRGYRVLVIENSEAAIQKLRNRRIPYIYGDADAEQVLDKTHLSRAKALAIALPDPASTRLLLQRALMRSPRLDVIARSHTDREIDLLAQMGAREVVQPEFEAAMELGAHLLRTLGEDTNGIQQVLSNIRHDRYQSVRS